MANLQFAYASPHRATLPSAVADVLPASKWFVATLGFDAISKLSNLPDFTWLDFGTQTHQAKTKTLLKTFAEMKAAAGYPACVFISGKAPNVATHDRFVEYILRTFPNPTDVQIDLVGKPDIRAAVARYMAVREAMAEQKRVPVAAESVASSTAPHALRVPNPDLRTARGNLSIKLIAHLFMIPMVEIGRLIGRGNRATLSKTPDADALQELLTPFNDIAAIRYAVPGDDEFRKWLRAPNDNMLGKTPLQMIQQGRTRDVAGFVHGALTGQSS